MKETKKEKVFNIINQYSLGLAAFEVAQIMENQTSWVAPRLTELEIAGKLKKTDLKRRNPITNKVCSVYRVVEK